MSNENPIVYLYPIDDENAPFKYAAATVRCRDNSSRHLLPLKYKQQSDPTVPLNSRERRRTQSPDPPSSSRKQLEYIRGLQLTLAKRPKAGSRYVIGTARDCDIVIPRPRKKENASLMKGLSGHHCLFSFDTDRRLTVTDVSTHGTTIIYGKQAGHQRKHFKWIIGRCSLINENEPIVIELNEYLKFRIVVPTPLSRDLFEAEIDAFLQTREPPPSRHTRDLGTHTRSTTVATAAISGARTPIKGPVFLDIEPLGEGGFGSVFRTWDVSTGQVYAAKVPIATVSAQNKRRNEFACRQEAATMISIFHDPENQPRPHLVELYHFEAQPVPRLIMEYFPLGDLKTQQKINPLTDLETQDVLIQGLWALQFLHNANPSIIHRDIKPGNILVEKRNPIHIRISDFGLASMTGTASTVCGSYSYVAPEILPYFFVGPKAPSYTAAVDVWSLGVVLLELVVSEDLPNLLLDFGVADPAGALYWCGGLAQYASAGASQGGLMAILVQMIVLAPAARVSAAECLKVTLERAVALQAHAGSAAAQPLSLSLDASSQEAQVDLDLTQKRARSWHNQCALETLGANISNQSLIALVFLIQSLPGIVAPRTDLKNLDHLQLDSICHHLNRLQITDLKIYCKTEINQGRVIAVFGKREAFLFFCMPNNMICFLADLNLFLEDLTVELLHAHPRVIDPWTAML